MNFFQIIRSLEELLYEVMTWLIFYPRTLWRCIRRPEAIMIYTTEELHESADDRFTDLLSPPLFLMLSILLAHALEKFLDVSPEESAEVLGEIGKAIVSSEQNLLLYRSFLFALFPLITAFGLIRRKGILLDRASLRGPFFQQCYFAGTYGLAVSSASVLVRHPDVRLQVAGGILLAVGTAWYLWVQTRWIRRELSMTWVNSAGLAVWLYLAAAVTGMLLGVAVLQA